MMIIFLISSLMVNYFLLKNKNKNIINFSKKLNNTKENNEHNISEKIKNIKNYNFSNSELDKRDEIVYELNDSYSFDVKKNIFLFIDM